MKYIAILKGEAEGCDYTLGCNCKVKCLEARNYNEAFEILSEDVGNDWYHYLDEYGLKEVRIYPADYCEVFDIEKIVEDAENSWNDKMLEDSARAEKELYERLKAKYDNSPNKER